MNTTLLALNLSNNKIDIEGVSKLADALRVNTTLLALDLSSTLISTEETTTNLDDALRVNTTLEVLVLNPRLREALINHSGTSDRYPSLVEAEEKFSEIVREILDAEPVVQAVVDESSHFSISKKNSCRKFLSNKIRKNIREMNEGRFKSRAQAIAVAYSQVGKARPRCKNIIKSKRKKISRKRHRSK